MFRRPSRTAHKTRSPTAFKESEAEITPIISFLYYSVFDIEIVPLCLMTKNELSNRKLIGDNDVIESLVLKFSVCKNDEINWTTTYLDNENGEEWLYYKVSPEFHGGGFPILARLPLLNTEELIRLAVTSISTDEVFAACATLVEQEKIDNFEFRSMLIDSLEQAKDHSRIERIIELTSLDFPLNRREILNKTIRQIADDTNEFHEIAERAKRLLERQ
jgi:hypothetical protein